jgi:hypothetical protein
MQTLRGARTANCQRSFGFLYPQSLPRQRLPRSVQALAGALATTAVAGGGTAGGGGGFGRGSGAQAPVACLQRASAPQGAAALVGPAAETRSEMGGKDM